MPKVDRQAFAERVNALREARGLSWKQLAAKVGSVAALRRWQSGRAWPRTETVIALSEALGVTTDYLLTGRAPGHPPCTEPRFLALKDAIEGTPRDLREALAYALLGKPISGSSTAGLEPANDSHPRPERKA
jgi:transcriptional regulator with XRE-family HTH domain